MHKTIFWYIIFICDVLETRRKVQIRDALPGYKTQDLNTGLFLSLGYSLLPPCRPGRETDSLPKGRVFKKKEKKTNRGWSPSLSCSVSNVHMGQNLEGPRNVIPVLSWLTT